MEVFEDSKGCKRELSLTIGKARRAAKLLDIDFLDGDPTKISNDLMIRKVLQVDLIWFLLDNRDGIEIVNDDSGNKLSQQASFEEIHLDSEAFDRARLALFAEIKNFIRSVRPEVEKVLAESIHLIRTQIMKSAETAACLFQSTEVQEGFLRMNADAKKKFQSQISKEFSKLQEESESTLTL